MKKVPVHPRDLKVGDIILWDDSNYIINVLNLDPAEEVSGPAVLLIMGSAIKNDYRSFNERDVYYLDALVLKNSKDNKLQGSRQKHWGHPDGCEMWLLT